MPDKYKFDSSWTDKKMSERRTGIALQILGLLAEENFPGLTRGEIRNRLDLPADTEITSRIRELRDYGGYGHFTVRVEKVSRTEYRAQWSAA